MKWMDTDKCNKREIGEKYERLAGELLEKKGYIILEYNFRCRNGEIDIIAMDGHTYVFVEVKYRTTKRQGHPLEAVHYKKQQVISKCALYYLYKKGRVNVPCRFDVVSIEKGRMTHVKNAFDYCE